MQPLSAAPDPEETGDFAAPARLVARRDPAPSRAAYRLHRLWLTPVFRALMRVGLPAFVVTMACGLYLSDADRRAALTDRVWAAKRSVEERPEFMVTLMAIDGASGPLSNAIRNLVQVNFPVSSFALDLDAMRAEIEKIEAVDHAELRIRPGGVLQIDVTERRPAVIWRAADGLFLLDPTGHRIAALTVREGRPDLALIAGAGAEKAVPEALALVAAAAPVAGRLRGLVRMGERRWDVVLDRGQRIELPAADPVAALERVLALDAAEEILARDVTVIDMRIGQRPTLRLSPAALASVRGNELKLPAVVLEP